MEKNMNKNNAAATLNNLDKLDREIENAYNRASVDKHEQLNRASTWEDKFPQDAAMAKKRANEFSSDVEELAKLKRQILKKKITVLKNQIDPPEVKVEVPVTPAPTKDEIKKARDAGMGAGFWIGALTVGGLALYAAYKTKKRHNAEVERLHKRINELEKNQK